MEILRMFAAKLAEVSGLSNELAFGLLKLCLKDAGLTPGAAISYQDYKTVFEQYLRNRLVAASMPNTNDIIAKMVAALNEKQSLIAMSAK